MNVKLLISMNNLQRAFNFSYVGNLYFFYFRLSWYIFIKQVRWRRLLNISVQVAQEWKFMADAIKKKSNWSLLCGMIIGKRLIQLFLPLIGWTSLWEKNTMLNKPNNSLSFISGLKILWRGVLDLNLFWISLDIFSRRKTQFTNKTITWISVMTWNQFSSPLFQLQPRTQPDTWRISPLPIQ